MIGAASAGQTTQPMARPAYTGVPGRGTPAVTALLFLVFLPFVAQGAPLTIYHFDVDAGDSTLIVTPGHRGVLIDAGNPGYGKVRVRQFLNRLRTDGELTTLEYAIVTHYDTDHQGGMDEVLSGGWYPNTAVLDRGDTLLPELNDDCSVANVPDLLWGTAEGMCNSPTSCNLVSYLAAAEAGGRRSTATPGQTFALDGVTFRILIANATDSDGNGCLFHFRDYHVVAEAELHELYHIIVREALLPGKNCERKQQPDRKDQPFHMFLREI